jgi:hypothetical protein
MNTLSGAIHLHLRLLDTARIGVLQYLQKGNGQIYSQTYFSARRLNRNPDTAANKDATYAPQQSAEMTKFLFARDKNPIKHV